MTAPLLDRLAGVEHRVRQAVADARTTDHHPDDPFRGLYLTERHVERILSTGREPFDGPEPSEQRGTSRLEVLAARAGLLPLDLELLLIALAPDVDSRFEQLYGYLNDDVTRRRATAGLALRLAGVHEAAAPGRARLSASGPLVACGLLLVEEPDRPFLSRALRVPDRVVAHLLGDDRPDPDLARFTCPPEPAVTGLPETDRLTRAVEHGIRLIYLRERPGGCARTLAASALTSPVLCADPTRMNGAADALALLRESLLTGAAVLLGPVGPGTPPTAALEMLGPPAVPVLVHGSGEWDPAWSTEPPLRLDVGPAPPGTRRALWSSVLGPEVDPAATAHFTLTPAQVRRAARAAHLAALAEELPVTAPHLRSGARAQNASSLERLARRIEPAVSWPDLVAPPQVVAQLRELADRARLRERVLGAWRMRTGGGRGRGVTALFAGDSGTGKTMSAEVVAAELGLDLYVVDLATVVDKYVGETEKNLERVFTEASSVNGVLLFDEADAIFGKRSEVRDAHDRYANLESAYLLQRMETFDGVAILSTNLRANLDEAFTRRLDLVIEFPLPDAGLRLALWGTCLGPLLPRADDLDLDFLAAAFELAGGHIRSAAVTAAYLAASADRPVRMADVVRAVAREYRKLGRLRLDREFGPYLSLVTAEEGLP
ncbi:ATP-binding protein [Nonomuraea polychroma]|uniref:ATP-binding protein n=1 Tax=Nonomuraea polychroma TaxID=46176 RepID=UPI003D8EA124